MSPEEIINVLDRAAYVVAFISPDDSSGGQDYGEAMLSKDVLIRALRVLSSTDIGPSAYLPDDAPIG